MIPSTNYKRSPSTPHRFAVMQLLSLLAALLTIVTLSGCSAIGARLLPGEAARTAQVAPPATSAPSATPTQTPVPLALPTAEPVTPPVEPTPSTPWLSGEVRVFPGPRHYVGDWLTVEVEVLNAGQLGDSPQATLTADGSTLPSSPFVAWSPLRENALVFRWAWNTADVSEGTHKLAVTLNAADGGDPQAVEVLINLEPAEDRPHYEETARWAQRINDCCRISYITNTAAERDIDELDVMIDRAFNDVEARLGVLAEDKPVSITLLDNVWGNGAYVSQDMVISYVDRAYTSLDLETTLRHEAAHWTLRSVGTSQTPSLLSEGAAVYVAGGHFKPEPLPERAAALLEADRYIPLADLTDDFWTYQHEIAYLEAAGLVTYLVSTYGMESFLEVYGAEVAGSDSAAEWLDTVFRRVYDAGLEQIEQEYIRWLGGYVPGAQATDLELTISLYDTIREYEDLYAQYQESLPSAQDAINAAQVAEFMREPTGAYNVALEAIFVSADDALRDGRYEQAEQLIRAVQATLRDGDFTRQPVAEYVRIVERVAGLGYETQRITLTGDNSATVEAIQMWPQLRTLSLEFDGDEWQIVDESES